VRLAGTILSLLCLLQQLGAICPGCLGVDAYLLGMEPIPSKAQGDSAPHRTSCCCDPEDAPLPSGSGDEQNEPVDTDDHPVHLCSGSHGSYPLPPDRVEVSLLALVDWLAVRAFISPACHPQISSAQPFSPDDLAIPRASLRARLQVFLI
jgi:hypothetical protein